VQYVGHYTIPFQNAPSLQPKIRKKVYWRSRCGLNDIIEMDTNAIVIKVRMDLFDWGLEQVEGSCDYGDNLVFSNKLLFSEFIENSRSLLQNYCYATLWIFLNVERTTSCNITFGLHSSNMNIQITWITRKT
jgi:hypothetical protein